MGTGREGVCVSVPRAEVQLEWVYLAIFFVFLRALDQFCII